MYENGAFKERGGLSEASRGKGNGDLNSGNGTDVFGSSIGRRSSTTRRWNCLCSESLARLLSVSSSRRRRRRREDGDGIDCRRCVFGVGRLNGRVR